MKKILITAAAAMGLVSFASYSHAQNIVWGPASNMVGDTDVQNNGTAFDALGFYTSATTVNGVTFNPGPRGTTPSSDGFISVASGGNGSPNAYGAPFTSASPSSTNYANATGTIAFGYYQDGTVTIGVGANTLTTGDTYQVQVWSAYNNAPGADATTLTGLTPTTLTPENYQYALGSFIATGPSETFNFNYPSTGGYGIINAVSVRDITSVPEPASVGLLAIGAVGLFSRRRRAMK